jgi:hypothetical protein
MANRQFSDIDSETNDDVARAGALYGATSNPASQATLLLPVRPPAVTECFPAASDSLISRNQSTSRVIEGKIVGSSSAS